MKLVRFFSPVVAAACLCGCASDSWKVPAKRSDKAFVRSVDCSETPEIANLANRARKLGNEIYPRILTVPAEDTRTLPRQFDIVFKSLKSGNTGETIGTKICINTDYLIKNATNSAGWLAQTCAASRVATLPWEN